MIKKHILTIVLLSFSILAFGQELPKEKSENHLQIEGTNIFMVPPALFELSTNFKGFQNPDDQTSMIMMMEIPGPYNEIIKGFTSEMMKPQAMELKSKKEIQVAEYNGLLIELDQTANGMVFSKQLLVYGNEKSSTLINGVYLKDSIQTGEKIKQSISTTFVDPSLTINPREALDYTLNEDVGDMQFKSVFGNGMLFNRDLKTPTESFDKASLLTDKSFAKIAIENKKLFCISRLKKYPDNYSVLPSKDITEITLDDLNGFELFAKNNDNENEEMYQVILFDENGGYYLFVGTYVPNSENAIADIKSIVQTFRRKK